MRMWGTCWDLESWKGMLNYVMFFKSSSKAKNLLDTMVSSLSFSVGCELFKSLGPKEGMMEMVEQIKYVGFPKVNCKPAHLFQGRLSEYLIWKVPSQNSKECVFYLILVGLVFVYFVLYPSKW